jgi:hypothetical protein
MKMLTFPLSALRTWSDDENSFVENNTKVRRHLDLSGPSIDVKLKERKKEFLQLVFLFYLATIAMN